jgi:predicted 3-demethylubiquinone-9 3-methyltransferase (glyoxalase superfamily)
MTTAVPFLMFEGQAEEAVRFYVGQFEDGAIQELVRFGPGEGGVEGQVSRAVFTVAGLTVRAFDSSVKHGFSFTPAFSLFVECGSEGELERLAGALGEGGQTLMPLGDYGFSRLFAWVSDRFGVSWQLNLG